MTLAELRDWLEVNEPDDMPYRPGAPHTGGVGLRESAALIKKGASPMHAGNDRGGTQPLQAPFDGTLHWKLLHPQLAFGSILRYKAACVDIEIQVAHTTCGDRGVLERVGCFLKGQELPTRPGNVGLSSGIHTHTECVMPYDEELREWILDSAETIVNTDGDINLQYLSLHCLKHGMGVEDMVHKMNDQIRAWDILEMTTLYMVRRTLPDWRQPAWGDGPTLHIDTKWLLQI